MALNQPGGTLWLRSTPSEHARHGAAAGGLAELPVGSGRQRAARRGDEADAARKRAGAGSSAEPGGPAGPCGGLHLAAAGTVAGGARCHVLVLGPQHKVPTHLVHAADRAAADLVGVFPLGVPLYRLGRGARDGETLRHCHVGGAVREVLFKDGAQQEVLLVAGGVLREALKAPGPHLVGDHLLRVVLEAVHPVVADAVAELLLLAPEHRLGQVGCLRGIKSLADEVLLHLGVHAIRLHIVVAHLLLGVDGHGERQELLVQEGHSPLQPPGKGRLVGAQHVPVMQPCHLADALAVELLRAGRFVEVQVAAKRLVRALAGEHHLGAQRLDLAR
mmetsp:Transcript_19617/g.51151  ORF Transcript_19617/g.51151 Transcript_19617/m.51151 type:complete len:332 (-) Transcript_19617:1170-2165(-)